MRSLFIPFLLACYLLLLYELNTFEPVGLHRCNPTWFFMRSFVLYAEITNPTLYPASYNLQELWKSIKCDWTKKRVVFPVKQSISYICTYVIAINLTEQFLGSLECRRDQTIALFQSEISLLPHRFMFFKVLKKYYYQER